MLYFNAEKSLLALALPFVLNAPLMQAADIDAGKALFEQECSDCHSALPGKNRKGPTLFQVVGRHAGSLADFDYSSAMKGSRLTWNAAQLDTYLVAPKKVVLGAKMKYTGLADSAARAAIISYLDSLR